MQIVVVLRFMQCSCGSIAPKIPGEVVCPSPPPAGHLEIVESFDHAIADLKLAPDILCVGLAGKIRVNARGMKSRSRTCTRKTCRRSRINRPSTQEESKLLEKIENPIGVPSKWRDFDRPLPEIERLATDLVGCFQINAFQAVQKRPRLRRTTQDRE